MKQLLHPFEMRVINTSSELSCSYRIHIINNNLESKLSYSCRIPAMISTLPNVFLETFLILDIDIVEVKFHDFHLFIFTLFFFGASFSLFPLWPISNASSIL